MSRKPFDINRVSQATRKGPASYGQCGKVASMFAGIDAAGQDQVKKKAAFQRFYHIKNCLWGYSREGKLTFDEASTLMTVKNLPKKYETSIKKFLAKNS